MIYALLSPEQKKLCRLVNLKKGEILFHEGDICEGVGIVAKGIISISSYSYQGIEMNYAVINKGEMFGNNLLFSSEPFYRGHVIAKTNVEVILIDKTNLLSFLKNNDLFLLTYLKLQSDNTKKMNNKIKTLSFYHVDERFIFYLKSHNNRITYHSITSLAGELNMSREVLSRLISKMIKEKTITKNGHSIILNNQ